MFFKFEDVVEVLAQIEEVQDEKDASGTHALDANLRLQGGGQGDREGGVTGEK